MLSDAMRAYDASIIAQKGKKAKPSELNLPDDEPREITQR
jgi:hypothetical protein